jgi:hypothetical protein
MIQPPRLVGLFGVAAVLTVTGAFGTAELMRALPRFGYWAVLVVLSYSAGYVANTFAERMCPGQLWLRVLVAGVGTAALVLPVVHLLNGLALGYWAAGAELLSLSANVLLIAVTIAAIFQMAYSPDEDDHPDDIIPATFSPTLPPLLDRLPLDKRGPLVSISVEDHYVRVRTAQGEELLLMRLTDAIREVGASKGVQVHRSHWVALDAVQAARREGDRAILTMAHGPEIPVSRTNVPAIREAGLLPR